MARLIQTVGFHFLFLKAHSFTATLLHSYRPKGLTSASILSLLTKSPEATSDSHI